MQRPKWPFLLMYASRDTRRIDFRRLTGSQWTPGFWGVTSWYQSLGKRLPWELVGCVYKYGPDTNFTAWYQSLSIRLPVACWA